MPTSGSVTIGAASMTLDQSTLGLADFNGGLDPATLTGSLTGFASNEGITFKRYEADGDPVRAAFLAADIARFFGYQGKYSIAAASPFGFRLLRAGAAFPAVSFAYDGGSS